MVPAVGEVTFIIGQSTLHSPDGQEVRLVRGASIRPGDRIETTAGGHVHIRFVDGAFVSVRPASRLLVEEYRYNPTLASQSQVRFRLDQGSTRAISGAAAENAKDRFRLNTPLVAIGVRGTDFTVQTSQQLTQAAVTQGAIVLAPLGEGCLAQSYGPCGTQTAQLLTADMDGLLAEYRQGLSQPQLRPQLAQNSLPSQSAQSAQPMQLTSASAGPESANAHAVAALRQELVAQTGVPPVTGTEAPPVASLVWGRWGAPQGAADISVPREQARAQGEAVVYGWPYTLYRQQPDSLAWPASLGKVGFQLQGASAQYQHAGQQTPVAVSSGKLSVDFANSRYTTQLQLEGVPYVLSSLAAAGRIGANGVFETRAGNQAVSGAVTFDAHSAAYMFQKASSVGIVNGITTWAR